MAKMGKVRNTTKENARQKSETMKKVRHGNMMSVRNENYSVNAFGQTT